MKENELKEIFNGIRNSSEESFEKLYSKYNKLVYGIAFSILKNGQDAEDVVQTVFAKIYDIDKSKLPTDKEASWLYTTTKNESITLLRKRNNHLELESIYEIEDENNEISEIISQDSYNRIISKLNDKEKEIVSLKILAKLSFDEIANLLNEPTGTIKWRYYKSIHTLKLLLSNLGMFIITFVIGIKTLFSQKVCNNIRQEISKDEIIEEDSLTSKVENSVQESMREEENKGYNEENFDTDGLEEEQQGTIIQEPDKEMDVNYVGIGILSLSVVFLVATIIFSIINTKYQLKRKDRKK